MSKTFNLSGANGIRSTIKNAALATLHLQTKLKIALSALIATASFSMMGAGTAFAYPGFTISRTCNVGAKTISVSQTWETNGNYGYVRARVMSVSANSLSTPIYTGEMSMFTTQTQYYVHNIVSPLYNGTVTWDWYTQGGSSGFYYAPGTSPAPNSGFIYIYKGTYTTCTPAQPNSHY